MTSKPKRNILTMTEPPNSSLLDLTFNLPFFSGGVQTSSTTIAPLPNRPFDSNATSVKHSSWTLNQTLFAQVQWRVTRLGSNRSELINFDTLSTDCEDFITVSPPQQVPAAFKPAFFTANVPQAYHAHESSDGVPALPNDAPEFWTMPPPPLSAAPFEVQQYQQLDLTPQVDQDQQELDFIFQAQPYPQISPTNSAGERCRNNRSSRFNYTTIFPNNHTTRQMATIFMQAVERQHLPPALL
ncbi:hypothetical protein H1R20_g1422, partial [Candolleomyces eurysporus]